MGLTPLTPDQILFIKCYQALQDAKLFLTRLPVEWWDGNVKRTHPQLQNINEILVELHPHYATMVQR